VKLLIIRYGVIDSVRIGGISRIVTCPHANDRRSGAWASARIRVGIRPLWSIRRFFGWRTCWGSSRGV